MNRLAILAACVLLQGCLLTNPVSECPAGMGWRGDCAQQLFVEQR